MPKSTGTASAPAIDCLAPRHEVTRRLSDKILTAFNHAYAIGETEIPMPESRWNPAEGAASKPVVA